jgi:hypothetical protein
LAPGAYLLLAHTFVTQLTIPSTGGIIALGLGHQGWTVQECLATFKKLAVEAFKTHQVPGVLETIRQYTSGTKYRTEPLEEAFKSAFSGHILFGDPAGANEMRTKTAVVTATQKGPVTLLSNYNRKVSDNRKSIPNPKLLPSMPFLFY